ncbi:MAG: phosphoribosylaminoimidazolesuccinocarboxamide synthase [gamma proteobacterium symbiont of Bathyaustriella thionipta]|nr:phosphoribosylaminoimidazolesuccinocarboxamide synthase [gamma proteobacterium symbiont of Bathyaustriella thionipta]MCU7950766.1 phosphoribosylaminoimidazolesuccinocarboxamide synthase [gamma proteobacterium symbiont of Bathyaustriella thionipta]MCU7952062.1 phosphoribosylaminoimidazolesuccinocarboxamide synthase [gamma proteobacterium symbiont of Bathyaustriella thionipta]MCU7957270.1 phosphoribosylaminoimidazolesuccinocarboxamide synthase [gamma proteobacterium symbiont of Bathyaustriella 
MVPVLFDTDLKSLPLIHRGKVRDIYAVGDDHMLIVTTDRLSAFDVILPTAIPGKGAILTRVANFWFNHFSDTIPNQVSDMSLSEAIPDAAERELVEGRAIVVKKLKALPVEAIVRGYIIGSGWKDYQANGSICGIELPAGLQLAEQLPEAIYTPSSKAAVGEHDENIDFEATIALLGEDLAQQIKAVSLKLYTQAARYALPRGIIIADTKFEFGVDSDNRLTLIDEALTPDSSRFWLADAYQAGSSPQSFDKQYVRDYLETLDWDKTAPGPELPDEVVQNTSAKYAEALDRLTR